MAKLLRASATVGGGVSQVELDAFTGTTNIATLGTVGTGTWEGTTVAVDQGGTGVTSKTGTGNVVLSSSPTLVTPALGTPASGVMTNVTGTASSLTAGTVTTNANLTGDITSSGNASVIASDVIVDADVKSDAAIAISKTALVGGTGLTLSTNTLNVDAAQTQITSVGTIATGTWEGTDVGVPHGGTGVSTLTDGGVLLGSGTGAITATAVLADGEMLVGDASGDPAIESGGTLRTSIGLGNVDNTADASQTSVGTITSGTWQGTTVAVNQGGTGATTHTANNVLIGAGTSAITSIAPGADGQVLTSTGSVWQSEAAAGGGVLIKTESTTSTSIITSTTTGMSAIISDAITVLAGSRVIVLLGIPGASNGDIGGAAVQIVMSGSNTGDVMAATHVFDEHHASSGYFFGGSFRTGVLSAGATTFTVSGNNAGATNSVYYTTSDPGGAVASQSTLVLMEVSG